MGPSTRFLSPICGLISERKNGGGGIFSPEKDHSRGGWGVRGGYGKRTYFWWFFFGTLPLVRSVERGIFWCPMGTLGTGQWILWALGGSRLSSSSKKKLPKQCCHPLLLLYCKQHKNTLYVQSCGPAGHGNVNTWLNLALGYTAKDSTLEQSTATQNDVNQSTVTQSTLT